MLLLPITREQLLQALPPGGVAAEIGVHRGEFSQAILRQARPARLHLVDPWLIPADGREDPSLAPAAQAESIYQQVRRAFEQEQRSGQVVIHRAASLQAAEQFAPQAFDWVYIDAAHGYKCVAADLAGYAQKIKPSGFLLGHDYSNSPQARAAGIGVVQAVDEFVRAAGWHFLGLTLEPWPTYVLCPDFAADSAKLLYHSLVLNVPNVVELRDYPRASFIHYVLTYDNQQARSLLSF